MSSRMRFCLILVAAAVLGISGGSSGHMAAQQPPAGPGRFVAGDILVKFRPGANANERAEAHRAARAAPFVQIPRTGVQRVRVPQGDESAAIARYLRNPNVLYAERNFIRSIPMPTAHAGGSEVVPGDHYFDEQWALHNTGQVFSCIPWISGELCLYSGTPDADIDAPEAWAIFQGSSSVTVAVIDSGVDYTHPDLAANYAGGDDFVFSDGDPMDDHGHGTHVAGTIAAALDNLTGTPPGAEGVAGVAPNARIRAYKVCRPDGTCDDFAIQQAIARAITDGANVINMSLGESVYSQSLDDAVQDAWDAGLVIVAGAGNDGTTVPFYPAALDNVISVAAFDEDHRRPSFSNYGNWVDISAPGNVIMSTYRMAGCNTSTAPGDTGCYTWNTGTSMATPHVAGAAALVWSRSDVTSNSQVVNILLNSADGQGVANVRLDSWTIHGGLNLHNAVSYGLTNLPPDAEAGTDQTVTDSDRDGTERVTLDGSASSDLDGSIVSYAWREGSTSIGVGATPAVLLSIGVHTLTLEVTDDDGDSATDNVVVTVNPANQVTVTASTAQATEAGPTNGMFTVTRTGDTSAPLTVHYTVAGTALAGTDYTSLPGTVTIGAGSSTATVAVAPIDDGAFESDESVILALSADAAYSLGSPGAGTVTIVSNDLPPDLVVVAVSAPATAGADADIVVTDTTKNQGTGPSLPSTTSFYLSVNSGVDASDRLIGSRAVPGLAPAASHSATTSLTIPEDAATGTFWLLAKADGPGAVAETQESNNTRAAVIRIGPDLAIATLSAPASAAAGMTIAVTDTTRNQGGGSAGASLTRFYLSANFSFDSGDTPLASRAASPLDAGASQVATTSMTVPAGTTGGQYYLIAVADGNASVPESIESNNTRAVSLRIGADMQVSALTAPNRVSAGATIAVTDTTKNAGAGAAGSSSTAFYLSANASFDASDQRLSPSRSVATLAAGASSVGTTSVTLPASATTGTWYVIARADDLNEVPEAQDTNNTRAVAVYIGPDLDITTLTAPSTVVAGTSITVTDTVKNLGADTAGTSTNRYYLSLNAGFDPGDTALSGERAVPALAFNASNMGSTSVAIPAGFSGRYYLLAVADGLGVVTETSESNNVGARLITINP